MGLLKKLKGKGSPLAKLGALAFGAGTPPIATHLVLLFTALAYYFQSIGDIHYNGFIANLVTSLDLGKFVGAPNVVHKWLCCVFMTLSGLGCYPNMFAKFGAKLHGTSVTTVQVVSLVGFCGWTAFHIDAFKGIFLLSMASGFGMAATLNSNGKNKLGRLVVHKMVLILALYAALAVDKFSNYHHMVAGISWSLGLAAFLSLGGGGGGEGGGKRGRSRSRR